MQPEKLLTDKKPLANCTWFARVHSVNRPEQHNREKKFRTGASNRVEKIKNCQQPQFVFPPIDLVVYCCAAAVVE